MDNVLRSLNEKAWVFTSGRSRLTDGIYASMYETISGLTEQEAQFLLFQSVICTTALLQGFSAHLKEDPMAILDCMHIELEAFNAKLSDH